MGAGQRLEVIEEVLSERIHAATLLRNDTQFGCIVFNWCIVLSLAERQTPVKQCLFTAIVWQRLHAARSASSRKKASPETKISKAEEAILCD